MKTQQRILWLVLSSIVLPICAGAMLSNTSLGLSTPLYSSDDEIQVKLRVQDTVTTAARDLISVAVAEAIIKKDDKYVGKTSSVGEFSFRMEKGRSFSLDVYFAGYHRYVRTFQKGEMISDTTIVIHLDPVQLASRSVEDGVTEILGAGIKANRIIKKVESKRGPAVVTTVKRGNILASMFSMPIPLGELKSANRVVCQPFFKDYTANKVYYTEPLAVDSKEFHATQTRQYGFKENHQLETTLEETYGDSMNVSNPWLDPFKQNTLELSSMGADTLSGAYSFYENKEFGFEKTRDVKLTDIEAEFLKIYNKKLEADSLYSSYEKEFDYYYGTYTASERKKLEKKKEEQKAKSEHLQAKIEELKNQRKLVIETCNLQVKNLATEVAMLNVPMEITINDPAIKNNHIWITGGYTLIEDYSDVLLLRVDTISVGVRDPFRFMDLAFHGEFINNPALYPNPETSLQKSNNTFDIEFVKGSAEWVQSERNINQFAIIRDTIEALNRTASINVKNIIIKGTSSPEGRYATNMELANSRMNAFRKEVSTYFTPGLTSGATWVTSQNEVASWDQAVILLHDDGKDEEADAIEKIWKECQMKDAAQSFDLAYEKIKQLPCYEYVLESILPKLRKVDFSIEYTVERELTLEEIEAKFDAGEKLYPYDMFKYYRNTTDPNRQLAVVKRLYEDECRKNPKIENQNPLYANDYCALLINEGQAKPELLEYFSYCGLRDFMAARKMRYPSVMLYNQVCVNLLTDDLDKADSLDYVLSKQFDKDMIKDYNIVHNMVQMKYGHFNEDTYKAMVDAGPLPEIVWFLASAPGDADKVSVDKLNSALKLCKQLCDTLSDEKDAELKARVFALRAMAYNRLSSIKQSYADSAYICLSEAFKLSRSVEKTCKAEADLRKPYKRILAEGLSKAKLKTEEDEESEKDY